jgi:hypothetical protein
MKLTRSAIVLVLVCAPGLWSQAGVLHEPTSETACDDEGKDPICRHSVGTLAKFRAEQQIPLLAEASPPTTDVTHCFLDLELHFDTQTISGTNTVTFRSLTDGLTAVSLDLDDNMPVDAATMGGAAVAYSRAAGKINITLDRTYTVGESFAVAVAYHGAPQNSGFSSFTWITHSGSILASTLSEPWYASSWWPCRDELVEKFTLDMWLTVPAGMVAVSNGTLEGTDTLSGNRLRYRWHESYPIVTYLVSLTATNYVSWSQSYEHAGGSMPVVFYSYPESQSSVQASVSDVLPAIQTFSQAGVYGEYPFVNEKYGIAQFAWGGGMEHQTITSQGVFFSWINVHELAHQWWGDMVTCGTWHDIWLNEGFASFSEALYEEKRPGGSFAAYKSRMQARRPTNVGGSVYVYDATSESTIFNSNNVYNKGAWAVHMLRHVLGDDAFFQTLAAYRATYEGGSAVTDEFKAVAEAVYGGDLDWYFNEWVYGTGAPSYRWGWRDVETNGQHRLALHVEQYQTTYANFRMPIDITVTTAGGPQTQVIWQEHDADWYVLPVDGPVSSVQFDKDTWILRAATANVTYSPPPHLTGTTPAFGSSGMYVNTLDLTFSTVVAPVAADFSVTGSVSGTRAFTLSQPAGNAARLSFAPVLPANEAWTVTVHDTLSSTLGGPGQFDGELADPSDPASLPSGDGVMGGDAVFTFSTGYPGDFDGDENVDAEDFGLLQRCLLGHGVPQTDPQCLGTDINHDSYVDGQDVAIFQSCLSGPGQSPPTTCGT